MTEKTTNRNELDSIEDIYSLKNVQDSERNGSVFVDSIGLEDKPSDVLENGTEPGSGNEQQDKQEPSPVGVFELFAFASTFDKMLLGIGIASSMVLGCAVPVNFSILGDVINTYIVLNKDKDVFNSTASRYADIVDDMMPKIYAFLVIGSLSFVSGCVGVFCLQLSRENQVSTIRLLYFKAAMRQHIGWYDLHKAGEISTHFSEDIIRIGEGMGDKVAVFVQWISTWIAAYIMALTQAWHITLILGVFTPIMVILRGKSLKIVRNLSMEEVKAYGSAGVIAEQTLNAIRTVQAFWGQEKESKRYNIHLTDAVNVASRKGLALGWGQGALWFIIFLTFSVFMWIGIVAIQHFGTDEGNIIPAYLGVSIGAVSLGNAFSNVESFMLARASAAKVFEIINLHSEIDATSERGNKIAKLQGCIKFQAVDFAYPSRPDTNVFESLNLEIEAGKHFALVGASGCGKSTLAQLIQRFYDPSKGKILLDGEDVKRLNVKWLRDQIGVVSQEPVLFDMSIHDNIRFGKMDASPDEVRQAAMDANAHEFIKLLPEGYATRIGEKGAQLSGGQKQRIAIARALVRNPRILILDEATSALDQGSEAAVQNALRKAEKGRTTITIAHRLSTIRHADSIVAIRQGKVEEIGTHDQLMEKKGLYFQLVQVQAKLEEEGRNGMEEDDESAFMQISTQHDKKDEFQDFQLPKTVNNAVSRRHSNSTIKTTRTETIEQEDVEDLSFLEIMAYNKPEWRLILPGTIASIIAGGLFPALSFIMSEYILFFEERDDDKQMDKTHVLASIVIGLAFFSAFLRIVQEYCFGKSGAILTARLRKLTFDSLINQDMEFFDQPHNQVGTLCSRLSMDASLVQGAAGAKVGQTLEVVSCVICALVIAFAYGWNLALVVCSFLPFMISAGIIQGVLIRGAAKDESKQLEEAGKTCSEVVGNIKTVASLGREDHFYNKVDSLVKTNKEASIKPALVFSLIHGIASSLLFFAYAASFYYGATLIRDGDIKFHNVYRIFSTIIFGGTMIGRQTSMSAEYTKAKLAASRIIALIKRKPKIDVAENKGDKLPDFSGNLALENAVFHYPTRPTVPVLNGMSLAINPGETVALVGASGCGKSTVTQILQRFYDLDRGSLLVDSAGIETLNLSWHRQQLSIVSQEPTLFDYSIRENIAYGDNTRTVPMDEILSAARNANIHNFIASLPHGYDTCVGNKGAQISGGQKQRIAIARALIRNPKVLLLDEATSALDSESEKIVQEAMDKASEDRTCITIAHRLSTIQNSDKIAVVDKGKIVELGTHHELMSTKGDYYKLYSAQNNVNSDDNDSNSTRL